MLRQLAGQTAIYGVSMIVPRMLNYFLVPYLVRVLTVSEFGVFTDLYSLIPFALVLLTMGLETGYFRFAGKARNLDENKEVFSTAWGAVSAVAILFMSVTLIFTPEIASAMRYADHPSYIRLVGAIVMLDVIAAIPFARLRQEGRAKRFMSIKLLSVITTISLTIFFYSILPRLAASEGIWNSICDSDFGVGYYLVANVISSFVVLVALIPAYKDTVPRITWKLLKIMLIYSAPLLLSGFIGTANQFVDRQLLKTLLPESIALEQLGIYGAVTKIAVILVLFVQMYRYAAEPFFLADFKKGDFVKANAEALKYFIIASITIFLGVMLFSDLFALLLGPEFREGMVILPIILLSYMFSGITLNLNFWYKQVEKTSYALWITCIGLVFTIGLNIALIPSMGYVGAAWARLACETVMLSVSYYLNYKHYPAPYDLKRIGKYFLLGALIYCTTFFTKDIAFYFRYPVDLLLITAFFAYVLRMENIDIKRLIKSVVKRETNI